jgi:hypothetical protein
LTLDSHDIEAYLINIICVHSQRRTCCLGDVSGVLSEGKPRRRYGRSILSHFHGVLFEVLVVAASRIHVEAEGQVGGPIYLYLILMLAGRVSGDG